MDLAPTESVQVDPQAEAWFASYVDPAKRVSEQRRRVRYRRNNRLPAHVRLQRRNTVLMMASFAFVGALTVCFYVVLSR